MLVSHFLPQRLQSVALIDIQLLNNVFELFPVLMHDEC